MMADPEFVVLGIHRGFEGDSFNPDNPDVGGNIRVRMWPRGRITTMSVDGKPVEVRSDDFVDENFPIPELPNLPGLQQDEATFTVLITDTVNARMAEL